MKNNFTQEWKVYNWEKIVKSINSKNNLDVKQALSSLEVNSKNIMSLLSPSANQYIEEIAKKAKKLTRQRFGNIVSLYIPLYVSNLCSNICTYCGFSVLNNIKRKILTSEEILEECKSIKELGFEKILLVSGEHEKKVGMDYFRKNLPIIRKNFSTLTIEFQPFSTKNYKELKKIGVDGVLVYQETYNYKSYLQHHLKGKKRDFFFRLNALERVGDAQINNIGIGVLLGLSDSWRADCYYMAMHLLFLKKKYWRSNFSVSFPRIQPCVGGISSKNFISDRELFQLICVFRLFFPDVEFSLSTREEATFRDNVIPIAINSISAYSKTYPGGYSKKLNRTKKREKLKQFEIKDIRTPKEIENMIKKLGLKPIWKDWDYYLGRKCNI
ncbi:2-iminoacetate synthase ThiH [Buchnera aphidicola]|uniref:2-iminoacetate synthase ThiH n=1 Tax=Buchnera aphidicola TaxID=9 RepID=UPI0031B6CFAB